MTEVLLSFETYVHQAIVQENRPLSFPALIFIIVKTYDFFLITMHCIGHQMHCIRSPNSFINISLGVMCYSLFMGNTVENCGPQVLLYIVVNRGS